jgi:protein-disulfide isomerase
MKLTSESKFFLGIVVGTFLIIIVAVVLLSRPPKPIEKNKLITPETHTLGNKDANVWLVEFSDFECPACHAFAHTVIELANAHKDTLFIAYRHFPLPQHPYAEKAAIAAESAGRQGKFWDMGQLLFDNQNNLSDPLVASLAASLSLDMEKFTQDSKNPSIQTLIDADKTYGEQLNLTATPTFFLNGVKLDVGTPEELKRMIEEKLRTSQ